MIKRFKYLVIFTIMMGTTYASSFVHPGITHKKSDLDRMKYQVQAQIDPWYTSYQQMVSDSKSSYDYVVQGNLSFIEVGRDNGKNYSAWKSDIRAAYYNAIRWYIEGNEKHAKKAIEIFNSWKNIQNVTSNGTQSLSGGVAYIMIEAAEIIKSTYDGWSEEDIQAFKDMLVYPGYSNTKAPSEISTSYGSFYWQSYQGDSGRHGNQGLSGWRTVMAMGIFLDNEIMYDRASRYIKGLSHRTDDIAYPSGPPTIKAKTDSSDYADTYSVKQGTSTKDYGFNELMVNYIWETGQCQESSRDQQHVFFGLGLLQSMAEMAWNQGEDLYAFNDYRLLKGLEFSMRYNVSAVESYSDQSSFWEPTVANENFMEGFDRTKRWYSKAISPTGRSDFPGIRPLFETSVAHYIGRGIKTEDEAKWVLRARDYAIKDFGYEKAGWTNDAIGWGALTMRRPDFTYGEAVVSFNDQIPEYGITSIPSYIEAENFDWSTSEREGRTYHDADDINSGNIYRIQEGVDIDTNSEGSFYINEIESGEWLTYTIFIPSDGLYDISVQIAAKNSNGTIQFYLGEDAITNEVNITSTGSMEFWENQNIQSSIQLSKGVHRIKVVFGGDSKVFNLEKFLINWSSLNPVVEVLHLIKKSEPTYALTTTTSGTNGSSISLTLSDTTNNDQYWTEIDRGNGYYSYQKANSNFCMDGGNNGADDQEVYLWECGETNQNQQWKKVEVESDTYRLEKRNSTSFAIDGGSSQINADVLSLLTIDNNNEDQQWIFKSIIETQTIAEEDPINETTNIQNSLDKSFILSNGLIDLQVERNYQVLDVIGKVLFENNGRWINLKQSVPGIYLIRIDKKYSFKVLKL